MPYSKCFFFLIASALKETAKATEKATPAQDKPKEDLKKSETKKTITITAEVKEAAEKDDKKPVKKNSSLDKKEAENKDDKQETVDSKKSAKSVEEKSAHKPKAKRDSSLTKGRFLILSIFLNFCCCCCPM